MPPPSIVGRRAELERLEDISRRSDAQFIAVYGRRRVGKTFLVETFFRARADVYLHVTGLSGGRRLEQVAAVQREVERVLFGAVRMPQATTFADVLDLLVAGIAQLRARRPSATIAIFLDELPWLAVPKGGLLEALDRAWNTRLRSFSGLTLIVCGSAAAWMIEHVVDARGGLHNRLTGTLRLLPFTLAEAHAYLEARKIPSTLGQTLELYMALGGVPHYLSLVQRGRSAAQNIGQLCFGNGELAGELPRLFRALFGTDGGHARLVRALASKAEGLTTADVAAKAGIEKGGRLSEWLRELVEAGFVDAAVPYAHKTRDTRYRIIDEFVWFAHRFIERLPRGALAARDGATHWGLVRQGSAYRAWSGYAFEGICLKHHEQIKSALGFAAVAATAAPWRWVPDKGSGERGAQIDLLFDRADRVFTLCEMKYEAGPLLVDRRLRDELAHKRDVFSSRVARGRQILIALVTPFGLRKHDELISNVVRLEDLFR